MCEGYCFQLWCVVFCGFFFNKVVNEFFSSVLTGVV